MALTLPGMEAQHCPARTARAAGREITRFLIHRIDLTIVVQRDVEGPSLQYACTSALSYCNCNRGHCRAGKPGCPGRAPQRQRCASLLSIVKKRPGKEHDGKTVLLVPLGMEHAG